MATTVRTLARTTDENPRPARQSRAVTLAWFVIWLIANNIGGHEPLTADPVNAWLGTLILAIALDLGAAHARTR